MEEEDIYHADNMMPDGTMVFTMKHFCGIGLAAPQIDISKKMIVADV